MKRNRKELEQHAAAEVAAANLVSLFIGEEEHPSRLSREQIMGKVDALRQSLGHTSYASVDDLPGGVPRPGARIKVTGYKSVPVFLEVKTTAKTGEWIICPTGPGGTVLFRKRASTGKWYQNKMQVQIKVVNA